MAMKKRCAGTAIVWVLALGSCSDPSAPPEHVAPAALAQVPRFGPEPLVGPVEHGWRLAPSGDFNQDGLQDVLWRDHTTNHLTVALMSGTRLLELGPSMPGPPHPDWIVLLGAVDYNLDGMADVLW